MRIYDRDRQTAYFGQLPLLTTPSELGHLAAEVGTITDLELHAKENNKGEMLAYGCALTGSEADHPNLRSYLLRVCGVRQARDG